MINPRDAWKRHNLIAIVELALYLCLPLMYWPIYVDASHQFATLNAPFYCAFLSSNVTGGCNTLIGTGIALLVWGTMLIPLVIIGVAISLAKQASGKQKYSKGAIGLAFLATLGICAMSWCQIWILMQTPGGMNLLPISPWALLALLIIQVFYVVTDMNVLKQRRYRL